ncbi:patellin-1-like [Juglans microcarpa x Juglans regia]|uniref:patellin-1-like n=1 Tax=Juglans microcarpa x Juglans regia TaxID=2249226 RepID=UPI001B7DABE7|nr:patellin-1-like [Juglans microcarpa x Juglans regia]
MAEEHQNPGPEASPSTEDVVVEKPIADKVPPAPVPEVEVTEQLTPVAGEVEAAQKPKTEDEEVKIAQSVSFKEETYVVAELPEPQKKALEELKLLIQEALNKHEFTAPPPPPPAKEEDKKEEEKDKDTGPSAEVPPKTEEPPKVESDESVTAPPPVEKKEEVVTEVVAAVETVTETTPPVETKEEEKAPPAPITEVVAEEVVEKVTAADEDGAKTVEAIKETIIVEVSAPPTTTEPAEPASEAAPPPPPPPPEEVSIWGIPLLEDERSDVILLKFLRARDFKVKDAFTMIKNTVRWRKEFGIDALLEEDHGNDWEKVVFTHGYDKEGHPVCYNVFREFQDKELYQNTFATEEKRHKFLKWRIQFLEKSIRNLDFSPTGISSIVQVNDFKNSFGIRKWELWQAIKQAVQLFQDNYPEFLAKQVFINVPWWYIAYNRMISPFLTQRTKSKFVFAGPSKSAETLFKYIAPEQVPAQYGGLKREEEEEFTTADPVTEVTIKPASKHTIEFPVSETGLLAWEVRVVGWDVSHGAEFVPTAEGGYTVIVQKTRKIAAADETVISNSFKVGEQGKVVLTFDNQTSKKKKLLYRSKIKPSSD